jgi:UDP-N-acetyl-D-glucosamine dehydrogenase
VYQQQLLKRLESREAVLGIYGLGYVGLPLMLRFCAAGFQVIGFDIDADKVGQLNSGQSFIKHIDSSEITSAVEAGFVATTDFSRTAELDVAVLCVPTPLTRHREPDLSYIVATVESMLPHLKKGQLLSLESTTYPGTTEEELLPRVEAEGLKVGEDFFLIYSPEREDPGNQQFSTQSIPKICGGHTPACLELGVALYEKAVDKVVPVSSTKTAEMTKLLENIHRSVNIGLVNEMKIVADKMDIDIHEVIDAAATKPFGFTAYYPGPGLGGHCIPIDPFYLTWKAREFGLNTRFIELAGEVNTYMPEWVISKLMTALNQRRKPLHGSKVLVLGVAYKKNVDDMRESPSLKLIELLLEAGAEVSYADPFVPRIPKVRSYDLDMEAVELTADKISEQDALLLATNHDDFDYNALLEHAQLLIDTRGCYPAGTPKVVKA